MMLLAKSSLTIYIYSDPTAAERLYRRKMPCRKRYVQVAEFKCLLGVKANTKNEYYDKTLQLPKEFDATTAW
ncbi:hypothetical protein Bca52824_053447 [Brassica carinata]|uniref:Uncharacterized protein n=1 Tax=Brassica carinata TaxID=52824 RepID=A0A8X7UKM1_BRACI|nr:hypothetical protein Bca52824_053447 [Brassica carinata]